MVGGTVVVVISTVASLQKGPDSWVRFLACSEPFSVEFACSPCDCVGSLQALWLYPKVQSLVIC